MTVLITGASRGIGKAIAEIFAANGKNLFLSSRSEVALYKVMEELQTKYPSVSIKAKAFDLSDKQQAKDLGIWCLKYAIPDIIINNAGLFEPGSVNNEPEGLLESQLAISLHSLTFNSCSSFLAWSVLYLLKCEVGLYSISSIIIHVLCGK